MFQPSKIKDQIYDLIDQPEYLVSTSEYSYDVLEMIDTMVFPPEVEHSVICEPYPDMTGGVASIAWIEDGKLQHEVICYKHTF